MLIITTASKNHTMEIKTIPARNTYNNIEAHEIKGYSMLSGTFFQSVEQGLDPYVVIRKAENERNIPFVAQVFGERQAKDIHKRIVYYSQIENQKNCVQ